MPSANGGAGAAAPSAAVARRASLDYLAPPACPGGAAFIEHVESRSTSLRLEAEVRASPAPDHVRVRLERDPSSEGWLGVLSITGSNALAREVRGTRCEDVVAALALISVLRLEGAAAPAAGAAASGSAARAPVERSGSTDAARPTAGVGEAAEPAAPGEPRLSSATPDVAASAEEPSPADVAASVEDPSPADMAAGAEEPSPADVAAGAEEPSPADVVAGAQESSPADEEARALPQARRRARQPANSAAPEDADTEGADTEGADTEGAELARLDAPVTTPATIAAPVELRASALAYLGYASTPAHALKAALGVELRWGESASSASAALAFAYAQGDDVSPDGTAALTLLTAELQLCPPGVSPTPSFWLRGCAQLRGGRLALSLSPSRRLATTDVARPWVAAGPGIEAGLLLSPRWTLRAVSGLMVNLIRDSFDRAPTPDDLDPEERVRLYRPEPVSVELLLGLGYNF